MQGLILTQEIDKYIEHNRVLCKKVFLSGAGKYRGKVLVSSSKKKRYRIAENDKNPCFWAYVVQEQEAQKKIWQGVRWNDQALQDGYHFFIVNNIHPPKPFPLYRDEEGNEHELIRVKTYMEWYAVNKRKPISLSSIYYALERGKINYTCPNDIEEVEIEKNSKILIIFDQKAQNYEVRGYELEMDF